MISIAMGTMLVFFWVLVSASAVTNRAATISSIRLRFEKENLIDSLRKANSETTSVNEKLQAEIDRREEVEQQLRLAQSDLENKVKTRTGELEVANRKLEEVNRELSDFTHSVSHDLRAPLAGIESFSELLEEELEPSLNEDAAKYLKLIKNSTERMKELIEDLLVMSRVDKSELVPAEVNMSGLVEEIVMDLQNRDRSRTVLVTIHPNIAALADFRLIRIALENMLDNAWKYTGKTDCPRIEFGARREGERMIYFVSDNGAGFDMAYADKLFVPFKRLHSSTVFPGTGIGLTTVQRIIRKHGGDIWADSEPGKGTTFSFTLQE
jgi:light-regulated signal transduction histidine kinase (bacteriophytochrome)